MALTNQLGQKAVLLILAFRCFQLSFCRQLNDDGKTMFGEARGVGSSTWKRLQGCRREGEALPDIQDQRGIHRSF